MIRGVTGAPQILPSLVSRMSVTKQDRVRINILREFYFSEHHHEL